MVSPIRRHLSFLLVAVMATSWLVVSEVRNVRVAKAQSTDEDILQALQEDNTTAAAQGNNRSVALPTAQPTVNGHDIFPPAPKSLLPAKFQAALKFPQPKWNLKVKAGFTAGDNSSATISFDDPGGNDTAEITYEIQYAPQTARAQYSSLDEFCSDRQADELSPWEHIEPTGGYWEIFGQSVQFAFHSLRLGAYIIGGGIKYANDGPFTPAHIVPSNRSITLQGVRAGRPNYYRLVIPGSEVKGDGPGTFNTQTGHIVGVVGTMLAGWNDAAYVQLTDKSKYILACTDTPLSASNETNPANTQQIPYHVSATLDGQAQANNANIAATLKITAFDAVDPSKQTDIAPIKPATPTTFTVDLKKVPRGSKIQVVATLDDKTGKTEFAADHEQNIIFDFSSDPNAETKVRFTDVDTIGADLQKLNVGNECGKAFSHGFFTNVLGAAVCFIMNGAISGATYFAGLSIEFLVTAVGLQS